MSHTITSELLDLFDSLLRAQLNTIRQLRKEAGLENEAPKEKSRSQIEVVYDILASSARPMHVDSIITLAKDRFDVKLDKESIVSALTKRIKRRDRFIKTGPNTFSLISLSPEGGRR